MTAGVPHGGERGFSLVAAMAGIAIMMILMGAAVPSWRYVMKNMREEELLFRGEQIAKAIERYQQKRGAPPASLEDLVKGKFLRKAWGDPMARDGKWKLIPPGGGPLSARPGGLRPGAAGAAGGPGGDLRGAGGGRGPGEPGAERSGVGGRLGAIIGVASTSTDESFRMFNGRTRYDEWFFIAGQPRHVGPQQRFGGAGLGLPGTEKMGPGRGRPGPGPGPGAGGAQPQPPGR